MRHHRNSLGRLGQHNSSTKVRACSSSGTECSLRRAIRVVSHFLISDKEMEAKIVKGKSGKALMLSFLLTCSLVFLTIVEAQSSGVTLGYWSLDEIRSDGYTIVTSDSTGVNHGTLGVDPLPMLVDGKFGKAMQFDGNNFLYIPISFIVGFPPSPQPIYMPISPAFLGGRNSC